MHKILVSSRSVARIFQGEGWSLPQRWQANSSWFLRLMSIYNYMRSILYTFQIQFHILLLTCVNIVTNEHFSGTIGRKLFNLDIGFWEYTHQWRQAHVQQNKWTGLTSSKWIEEITLFLKFDVFNLNIHTV